MIEASGLSIVVVQFDVMLLAFHSRPNGDSEYGEWIVALRLIADVKMELLCAVAVGGCYYSSSCLHLIAMVSFVVQLAGSLAGKVNEGAHCSLRS